MHLARHILQLCLHIADVSIAQCLEKLICHEQQFGSLAVLAALQAVAHRNCLLTAGVWQLLM